MKTYEVLIAKAYWHSGRATVEAKNKKEAMRLALKEAPNTEFDLDNPVDDGYEIISVKEDKI